MKTKCPVFCYHGVKENPRPWGVSVGEFEKQVKWLSENYEILTASQAYNNFRESGLPENAAVLTFDDGLKSAYEASKILDKYDVKGTYYIISGLIGQLWEGEDVMSEDEIRQLSEKGHEIGVHTVSHPELTNLSSENIKKEIRQSKKKLSDITGSETTSLAYPYGDYDEKVVEALRETEIETAFTAKPSSKPDFDKPYTLPRLPVFRWHKVSHIRNLAEGKNKLYRNYWYYPMSRLKNRAVF